MVVKPYLNRTCKMWWCSIFVTVPLRNNGQHKMSSITYLVHYHPVQSTTSKKTESAHTLPQELQISHRKLAIHARLCQIKGTVVPVHTMKVYGGVGVQLQPLELQQEMGWMAGFMPWLIYNQVHSLRYLLNRQLGGPQSRYRLWKKDKALASAGNWTTTPWITRL
jgi:hypothetical protein